MKGTFDEMVYKHIAPTERAAVGAIGLLFRRREAHQCSKIVLVDHCSLRQKLRSTTLRVSVPRSQTSTTR